MIPKKKNKKKLSNKLIFITILVVASPFIFRLFLKIYGSISITNKNIWCYLHMVFISCSLLFYAYLIFLQRRRGRLSLSANQYELDPNLTPGQVYWMINNDYNKTAYLSDFIFQKTESKQNTPMETFNEELKEKKLKQTMEFYDDKTVLMNLLCLGIVFVCNIPYLSVGLGGEEPSSIITIICYFFSSALFFGVTGLFLLIIKLFKIKGFNSKDQFSAGCFGRIFAFLLFVCFNGVFLFLMTYGTGLFTYNFSFFILLAFFFAYSSTKDYHFLNTKGKKLKKDVENLLIYMQQSPKSSNGRYQLDPHLIPFAIASGFEGYDLQKEEEMNFILDRVFYEKTDAEINLIKENIENMYKD